MRTSAAGVLCLILATQAVKAQQTGTTGGPLSAIDWLSQSVATPTAAGTGATAVTEPPVAEAGTAVPAGVTTSSLDAPSPMLSD